MNWIDVIFIALIIVMLFEGIYRGFLYSAINLGGFFLSAIFSYLIYPVVSASVKASDSVFNFLLYYTEGAEKIKYFEDASLLVNNISAEKLDSIVTTSSATEPFSTLIRHNLETKAFAADGLTMVGEYFNMTIVCAVLNILSFLAIFILARIICTFVLGAVDYTVRLPELKQYDRTFGALFGGLRGVIVCFLIVTIVPVIFLVIPVDKITEYFQSSSVGMFFYQNNFFIHFINGI